MTTILFQLLVAYAAARVLGRLAGALGFPAVIGELLAGALLGPHLLDLVHRSEFFEAFAELGVIFLLFEAGLEARVRDLLAVRGSALRVGFIGVALPFAGGLLAALAFGEATSNALFVATAFVATSVGITITVLRELGVQSRRSARIILAAAVLDDILGLIVLVVVKGVALGESNPTEIALIALEAVAFVAVVVVAGPPLAARLSHLVKRLPPGVVFDASIVLTLGLSLLAEYVGLAAIVGAFLAGLLLGELEDYDPIQRRIEPLTAFFVPFFFVLMGTYVDFAAFANPLIDAEILVFTAVAVATKYAGGWVGALREGGAIRREVGAGMVPRGEVGIVVAGIAFSAGAVTGDVYVAVISMVLATTFLAPFIIRRAFAGASRPLGTGSGRDDQAGRRDARRHLKGPRRRSRPQSSELVRVVLGRRDAVAREPGHGVLERRPGVGAESREDDPPQARARMPAQVELHLSEHGVGAGVEREAAHPGAEGRQGQRAYSEALGGLEDVVGRPGYDVRVRAQVLTHDGGVDDPARLEVTGARDGIVAHGDRCLRHSFALDRRAPGALDGPGDARPHPQVIVGGVDDGIDLQRRDVAALDLE